MEYLSKEPPKCFLVNLETNEKWEAPLNPSSLTERLEVKYQRHSIVGLSHEKMHYTGTGNVKVPVEFFISQQKQDSIYGVEIPNINDDRNFLMSLCYPANDIDYGYKGTPQILFVWPGTLRIVGRVISYTVDHRAFNINTGTTTLMILRIDIEEDLQVRRMMDGVRTNSAMRSTLTHTSETEIGGE